VTFLQRERKVMFEEKPVDILFISSNDVKAKFPIFFGHHPFLHGTDGRLLMFEGTQLFNPPLTRKYPASIITLPEYGVAATKETINL
jgi:hypothetical protein